MVMGDVSYLTDADTNTCVNITFDGTSNVTILMVGIYSYHG